MKQLITNLEQVTADWLTDVLTASGALSSGRVAAFDVDTTRGNWSSNGLLNVQYTAEAQGERPQRLFLKMVDTDTGDGEYFDDSEVTYYTRDYVDVEDAPLLRCYDGAYSAELMRYHLLLADVSETHMRADYQELNLEYGYALAKGLAAMHSRWWGADGLAAAGQPIHDAAHIQRFVDIAAPGADYIIAGCADELQPDWPELMRDLYARQPPALIKRTQDVNGFTLIHGDANPSNILVAREGVYPLYIIDRQPFDWSLTSWLGVYDFAYSMILFWDIEARRVLEKPILRHYHEQLGNYGVTGYSWEQLWDDYRLTAAMGVYIATEWCRGGNLERHKAIWMPQLRRSLTACEDLKSYELW